MRLLRLTQDNGCPIVKRDAQFVYIDLDGECWQERRRKTTAKARPQARRTPAEGPGTELKKMLADMGVSPCRSCVEYAEQMNRWGIEGCKSRLDEIIARLEARAKELGWFEWVKVGTKAVALGLPKTARGLAAEAIRRAEALKLSQLSQIKPLNA